ncbi:MAG: signal recognition particle-docking protein FtsY [Cocleimonas sp.]
MFSIFKKKKPTETSKTPETDTIEEQQLDAVPLESINEAVFDESPTEKIDTQIESKVQKTSVNEPNISEQQIFDKNSSDEQPQEQAVASTPVGNSQQKPKKEGLFKRLRSGLSKTGSSLTEGMSTLVLGKKKIDEDVLEDLETRLLMADVGMEATQRIIEDLTKRVKRDELDDVDMMMKALYAEMSHILRPIAKPLIIEDDAELTVILLVGINGAGKTTTIGKLAKKFQSDGKSVMLAAGDTFRAAAVEQLQVWGERNDIPVVAQGTGADSASVIYDAMESAKARNIDVLLADTAGRLHTQTDLMEELKKVKRVMQKIDPAAPHEIMLIVDAGIGQNALLQAKEFNAALGLTGITVTKLDGTAKGGILFAIAEKTGIPVRYIGVGESIDDLQEFDAYEFTGALLAGDDD